VFFFFFQVKDVHCEIEKIMKVHALHKCKWQGHLGKLNTERTFKRG